MRINVNLDVFTLQKCCDIYMHCSLSVLWQNTSIPDTARQFANKAFNALSSQRDRNSPGIGYLGGVVCRLYNEDTSYIICRK